MYANYKYSDCREEGLYPLQGKIQPRERAFSRQATVVGQGELPLRYDLMPRFRGKLVLPSEIPTNVDVEKKSYALGFAGGLILLTACILGLNTIWNDVSSWPAAVGSLTLVFSFFLFSQRNGLNESL